jgi:tRNA(Ile)-lysidine synthase
MLVTPDPADPLVRKVAQALRGACMEGKHLLIGVSGGPDSLALLYALYALQEPFALRLGVGTVDHGLRRASAREVEVVARQAQALGLPCRVLTADVQGYRRRHRLTLEQAAREVRYGLLAEAARETGADAVALGHTASDQAETLLLHLVRGSGWEGMRGMRVLAPIPTPRGPLLAFRPLLTCFRAETEAFCRRWGLSPVVDESNMDYLDTQVRQVWGQVVFPLPSGVAVDVARGKDLHPALQRHLLRALWEEVTGSPQGLTHAHLEAMVEILTGPAGRRLLLPKGVVLERAYGQAWLFRGDVPCPLPTVQGEVEVRVPGSTPFGGWEIRGRMVSPPVAYREGGPLCAYLDADVVGEELRLRGRRPGDRFWPLGMEGPKRLQDFFVDAHIPRRWRERIALLEGEGGIVWVVGVRIAHWARVTPQTRRVLVLEVVGKKDKAP